MSTLVLEEEPLAVQVTIKNKKLSVDLADGRSIAVPLSWYPRLGYGSSKERKNWRLLGNGNTIEWPELDFNINTEALLMGKRSRESKQSFESWLASREKKRISVEEGNGSKSFEEQKINFDSIKTVDQAHERYGALVDKKFQQGLTEEEQSELEKLKNLLNNMEKPFYEPIIQRLTIEKNKLSKDSNKQH
ncbi:MAG: DUF2442 domain-containing protein [bacterium]